MDVGRSRVTCALRRVHYASGLYGTQLALDLFLFLKNPICKRDVAVVLDFIKGTTGSLARVLGASMVLTKTAVVNEKEFLLRQSVVKSVKIIEKISASFFIFDEK